MAKSLINFWALIILYFFVMFSGANGQIKYTHPSRASNGAQTKQPILPLYIAAMIHPAITPKKEIIFTNEISFSERLSLL